MNIIKSLLNKLVEKQIYNFQNQIVSNHMSEVENIYKQMRSWRHDYHNHLQTMKGYISLDQIDELTKYIHMLDQDLSSVDVLHKTGNVMIDAILNSKISLAQSKGIVVNSKAVVPTNIPISDIDLCVIIGNLIDNAIEACVVSKDFDLETDYNPFIRVYIGILKEQLYISITNSVFADIVKEGKSYKSTKKSSSHGFGLIKVDKLVQKYSGYLNRQDEQDVFATEIMLPL